MEKDSLWGKLLVSRYGLQNEGGWNLDNRAATEGSSVIKSIIKLGSGEGKIGATFLRGLRILVGRGDKTLFWKDKWIGESSLSQAFPRLFRATLDREALVKDYYNEVNGDPH